MTEISFPPLHDLSPGELETRKQHLLSEIRPQPDRRLSLPTIPRIRFRYALPAVAAVCAAAAFAVIFTGAFGGSRHHGKPLVGSLGNGSINGLPLPTLAHPLPLPFARQVPLADAQATLGAPIVLPNTALVQPSDAGPVWLDSLHDQEGNPVVTNVAVTFPSQGVIVGYTRPAPSDGSAAHFRAMAQSMPSPSGGSEGRVITLNGEVPALAVQQNSDDTGHNFSSVIFNMAGSEVSVIGHNDKATLESLALSILNHSKPK
jgi:hypothetical protein